MATRPTEIYRRRRRKTLSWGVAAAQGGVFAAVVALTPPIEAAPAPAVPSPAARAGDAAPAIAYERDIRPILSDKCYPCHGPDAEARKAELRLDLPNAKATAVTSSDQRRTSELVRRILAQDPEERMPPPESGLSLSPAERALLVAWVDAGAPRTEHWAFVPLPKQVEVPAVQNGSWPQSTIDRFVLAELESRDLQPSPCAAPLAILRRMTFDLTGLPPTPSEVAEFEAVAQGDLRAALVSAVERLLAASGFGEHLAVTWLDGARYADSHGYQSDQLNTQWPYRDWVVRALNDNLPYDKFLTWQLAGDLLPHPTPDQLLATAFCRMHRMTNEGGSIALEWLNEYACDRVHTFGTAVLGLTLECARCHDHKYDPILQRDYYAIQAFFNSIDENGLYDSTDKVPSPSLLLPTPAQQAEIDAARQGIADAERALDLDISRGEARFRQWLANPDRQTPAADLVEFMSFDEPPSAPPRIVYSESREPDADHPAPPLPVLPGQAGMAVQFDGDRSWQVAPHDRFRAGRTDPFTIAFWIHDPGEIADPVVVLHQSEGTDVGPNGFDVMLAGGVLEARLYRVWPGNAIGVRAKHRLPQGAWRHIAVVYDGSSSAQGLQLFVDGKLAPLELVRDRLHKDNLIGTPWLTLGGRFRDRGFRHGRLDELHLYQRALSPLEIGRLHGATSGDAQGQAGANPGAAAEADGPSHAVAEAGNNAGKQQDAGEHSVSDLRTTYFSAVDAPARARRDELRTARRRLVAAETEAHEVAVMQELAAPRPAYVLARGAYDAPRTDANRVDRDVFANVLLRFPADAPRNRLGLAQWLTSPEHPLTARVFVNRLWANFFGVGLSANPENFGSQGAQPTHPALLDWLARDFVDHGWDVKRLCRQIVLSAVYQQEARVRPELLAVDPENRLLARGPIRRLSGEQLRDAALASSGLLARTAGGPPVAPYQPGGDLWREANAMSPAYVQSTGSDLYRRSLYSVWKRTAPLPNMLVFDAPTREVCTVRRTPTSTPLQALVLLNDWQFVEAARGLAQVVVQRSGDADSQIAEAFVRVAGRRAGDAEMRILAGLYREQIEYFRSAGEAAARQFIRVGALAPTPNVDSIHLAALTVVCQTLLNLDAAVYVR